MWSSTSSLLGLMGGLMLLGCLCLSCVFLSFLPCYFLLLLCFRPFVLYLLALSRISLWFVPVLIWSYGFLQSS